MNWPDDFVNKIICGDCLEVMKEMPDECVDLVLTDPPWPTKEYFDSLIRVSKKAIVEACKLLHRNFIGIKINPDYCKISEERLAQGVL